MLPLELELTDEERDRLLEQAAQTVTRRRMEMPAVLALEMHRPLTFLSSQALIVFTPLLAPAFGLENLQKLTRLLEDRANIDRLIERIEALANPEAEVDEGSIPGPGAEE